MGKKSSPAPPPAPDAATTAAASAAANKDTALLQQKLNMVNTSGPQGSVTWTEDPTAPGGYRQTTAYSPEQQAIYNGATQAQTQAIGNVNSALGKTINPSDYGQLTYSVDGGPIADSFNKGGALQYSFNPGQSVQGDIGQADISGAVNSARDAAYQQATSRLDPQWALDETKQRTALANQGLDINSPAWQNAMDQFGRSKTDAYNQANLSSVQTGDAEQAQLFGQQAQQGTFHNAAANQEYTQNQGLAAFNNATAGQDYSQNQGAAAFQNNAQNQKFNQGQANAQLNNTAQQQGFQQASYAQTLPIQEFSALMSGGQVAGPQGISYTPTQVAPTDYLGAQALQTGTQQANYKAQLANQQAGLSGLYSLGSAGLQAAGQAGSIAALFSERRLKTDIKRVGHTDDGLPIYTYRYKAGGPSHMGVMVDEAQTKRPEAVRDMGNGFLGIDYGLV